MTDILTGLTDTLDWLAGYRDVIVVVVGLAILTLAAVTITVIMRKGHTGVLLSTITAVGALAFSAEGMWEVLTQKLGLPPQIAAGLFFTGEMMMVTSAYLATKYIGDAAKAHLAARPVRLVWIIAIANGAVVAVAGQTLEENLIRLLVPLGAAATWWVTLPPQVRKHAGVWDKICIWAGWKDPEQVTLTEAARRRRTELLVDAVCRYHESSTGLLKRRAARRARKLARRSDEPMYREVIATVDRTRRILVDSAPRTAADVIREAGEVADIGAEIRAQTDLARRRILSPPPRIGYAARPPAAIPAPPRPPALEPAAAPADTDRADGAEPPVEQWKKEDQPVTSRPRPAPSGPRRRVPAAAPVSPATDDQLNHWMGLYRDHIDAVKTHVPEWDTRSAAVSKEEVHAAILAAKEAGQYRAKVPTGSGTLLRIRACVEALSERTSVPARR